MVTRSNAAVGLLFALALILIWAGWTGRFGLLLAAIISPSELQVGVQAPGADVSNLAAAGAAGGVAVRALGAPTAPSPGQVENILLGATGNFLLGQG